MSVSSLARHLPQDPRYYQIGVLTTLLLTCLTLFDFDLRPASRRDRADRALGPGAARTAELELARFDPRSALISALSLCLLLRTDWLALAAAGRRRRQSASKFVLRVRGKHVFNPTNFAIVALMLVERRRVGVAGPVGPSPPSAFLLAVPGRPRREPRAARGDVTLAFIAACAGAAVRRARSRSASR